MAICTCSPSRPAGSCGSAAEASGQSAGWRLGSHHLNVFISISLKQQSRETLQAFEERITLRDEVMECYLMTGDADYLLRVAVPDMPALERFILEQISPIAQVEKIRSSFALKQVRYKTALPLHAA